MAEILEENWYTNENATFGDRLVAAREACQLSSKGLARHLGVATKTVEKWENDLSEPRANKLQMLSGILNVSIPWLLTGEGQQLEVMPEGSADMMTLLSEVRSLRSEMVNAAERLAVLEKRMKQAAEA